MAKLHPQDREDLQIQARAYVRSGYLSLDELEDALSDMGGDFDPQPSPRDLKFIIREAVIKEVSDLLKEQKNWAPLTDYDRLELAMETLEDSGIVARPNFTCCQTCGSAEIGLEIQDYETRGRACRGYVFFHQQDTDAAVDGHGLYFSYGAGQSDAPAKGRAVGQALYDQLTAVGLKPGWNGDLSQRVYVKLNWQRRWTGPAPMPLKRWFY